MAKKEIKKPELKMNERAPFWTYHRDEIQSPEIVNEFVGERSAWKDDDIDSKPIEYMKIGDDGKPEKLINPEAYLNDAAAFWSMHEQKLIIAIILCSIYIFLVVF